MLALVGYQIVGPSRLHDLNLFFASSAAIMEILAQSFVFDLVPPGPQPESQATPAQHIYACRLFSHQRALPLGQYDDTGCEFYLARYAG